MAMADDWEARPAGQLWLGGSGRSSRAAWRGGGGMASIAGRYAGSNCDGMTWWRLRCEGIIGMRSRKREIARERWTRAVNTYEAEDGKRVWPSAFYQSVLTG